MIHRSFRIAILVMALLTLFLLGCTPTSATQNSPAITSQNPAIVESDLPTEVVAQEQAAPPLQADTVPQDQPVYAALDGVVWNDLDRDGLMDWEEPGIPGLTVNLFTGARAFAGNAVTDPSGLYRFQDLIPGDYLLSVQMPPGYVLSPQDQGENELVDSDADPATAETIPVTLAAGENGVVWTAGVFQPAAAVRASPGTVRPPPSGIRLCNPGNYSPGRYPLGGVSIVRVNQLAPNYCLEAFLRRQGLPIGRIPDDAGTILAGVTFIEFFYQNALVYKYDVPGETESIQVCYAVPVGRQVQIYFFDHYGPRFGQPTRPTSWTPLETTIQDEFACAVAQTSGAYALIGK